MPIFSLKTMFLTLKIKYDSQSSSLRRMIFIVCLLKYYKLSSPLSGGMINRFQYGECRWGIKPILPQPSIRL